MYKFDAVKVKNDCVQWIKDWFEQNGKNCNAIIGISGGCDSSVVAALLVEALGKDRVVGVLMPNGIQNDIDYAIELIEHLEITYTLINIEEAVSTIRRAATAALHGGEFSEQSDINLPPRVRMTMLYAISQSINGRVANTCNLSEDWVGYSTR